MKNTKKKEEKNPFYSPATAKRIQEFREKVWRLSEKETEPEVKKIYKDMLYYLYCYEIIRVTP